MILGVLASLLLSKPFDFYGFGPYPRSVARPDELLGYAIGTHHSTYRDQEQVVLKIAETSPSTVKMFQYGKSTEGRPLRIFAVSTPDNIRRLKDIQGNIAELASGQPKNREAILAKTPAIVWINECIHGDETASFESAMPLLYNLASSPKFQEMLKNAVVIVNPVYNPDGHERYVVYYNSIETGSPENESFESAQPPLLYGRLNHYRFDMNRDRVAMSQDETRQEVTEFLKWTPQVYCDQHGQVSTYFFPPNPMSINDNVDRNRVAKWTDIFGRATGAAFDSNGWSYFVKDEFDLFYAGYLDSWTTLSGAIGMTHETDGGRFIARRRSDDSLLTLRDGVAHHFTSALAVIGSAAQHRQELLTSFADYKHKAATAEFSPTVKRYLMTGDARALRRLAQLLAGEGVKSNFMNGPWDQAGATLFGDTTAKTVHVEGPSLVVDLAQPQGFLAKALLERQPGFEPQFTKEQLAKKGSVAAGETYPGPEGNEFYDFTGWSLPYAHGLTAYECSFASPAGPFTIHEDHSTDGPVGLAIPYTDEEDILAVAEILSKGVHGMVSTKPMHVGDVSLPRGTFLFLAARNGEGYKEIVRNIAYRHGCTLRGIPTSYPEEGREGPGSGSTMALKKANIGILFGTDSQPTDFSAAWYLFERRFHLPFTPLSSRALRAGVLAKYTTIVVPGGGSPTVEGPLKDWVQAGGTLVVLGSPQWALAAFQKLDPVEGEMRDLPGAIFRADLDPRSFLSYGYPAPEKGKISIAVPTSGSSFFKARKEGGTVVQYSSDEKSHKLLSGWDWPDETDKALTGAAWLQDVPTGQGHVIIFLEDPLERAMWPGTYRMFLNAVLLGPGV